MQTADLRRKHGISDATFYNWKSKYGGVTVSETARLRTLEDENRRLKKLLAESILDVSALNCWEKTGRSAKRYAAVEKLMADHGFATCSGSRCPTSYVRNCSYRHQSTRATGPPRV